MTVLLHSNGTKYEVDSDTEERMRLVHRQALHLAQEEILFNAVPANTKASNLQQDRVRLAHVALRDRLLEFKFGVAK